MQERARQSIGSPGEVALLQQQLQLKERERESLVEQLERERVEKERERGEKERSQQELVRQTRLCVITMFIILFEYIILQLFNRRQLATSSQQIVVYY